MAIAKSARSAAFLASPSPRLVVLMLLYVILMGTVIWSLVAARQWALRELTTRQSVRDWQAWRADVRRQQTEPGPVRLRVPKSAEPPALVLMRDYFAVCVVGALLFVTLLYWISAWFVAGIIAGPRDAHPDPK